MKITVKEAKKNEDVYDITLEALHSPEYKKNMQELNQLYKAFEKKVSELGYTLALDMRGDYMLTAFPREFDYDAIRDEKGASALTKLLDGSFGLGEKELITLIE